MRSEGVSMAFRNFKCASGGIDHKSIKTKFYLIVKHSVVCVKHPHFFVISIQWFDIFFHVV